MIIILLFIFLIIINYFILKYEFNVTIMFLSFISFLILIITLIALFIHFNDNLSKVNKIKFQLIFKNPEITQEEIFKLEQDYAVYTNSITDGVLIKIFSISKDYKLINNINNQQK
jgi:hypothetical protein